MKKIIYTILILLIFALIGFFFVAAKVVDGQTNILERRDHGEPDEAVGMLHDSLFIADWHSDNLLWDRNILEDAGHGHVDVPRLIKGNVALQVFDAVIKSPKGLNYDRNTDETDNITLLAMINRWPTKTWSSLFERALYQSQILHDAENRSEGKLQILKSKQDLNRFFNERKINKELVGGILAIEGLHALEGNINNLNKLSEAGFRIMGLTHFFDNKIGGSSAGVKQGGITDFGRKVIRRMNELNIIIDLAHASPSLTSDVLELTEKPVVVTHTGVKGTFDSPRNLSDEQLLRIAKLKGVVGIGFWDGAVGSSSPRDIAKAIRYTVNLIGLEHVCLGSDWDGATSIYFDAANIWVLTEALINEGFSNREIYQIMGGNQLNFLLANLPS